MISLNALDTAFVRMDSAGTPMHVGGLLIFRMPPRSRTFMDTLYATLRSRPIVAPPFNYRLQETGPLSAPRWQPATWVDLDYHVRRCCLSDPRNARALDQLVSHLHSQPLDLSRPPWECHLIEGLPGRRFALYLKIHHAAVDGIGALKLIRRWLADDPQRENAPGPWSIVDDPRERDAPRPRGLLLTGWEQLRSAIELGTALRHLFRRDENPEGGLRSAFRTPATPFNVPVSPWREFAGRSLDLARLRRVAGKTGTTINDLALAICSGALRRYLAEDGQLPAASLVASVPVGLPRRDGKPGNAVAGFVCPLATDADDPLERLRIIHAVTQKTKQHLRGLSPAALGQFTLLGFSPLVLGQLSGLATRLPPLFNLVVSNIVGSRDTLYLHGAELEGMYPVSVLFDGYALNLSLVGYAGHLTLGFTACPRTITDLPRLADYAVAALAELEQALGLGAAGPTDARQCALALPASP